MDYSVVTIKWGQEFTALDVNILYRAVRDNSSVSFKFFCLTDYPDGLLPEITAIPIPQTRLNEFPKSRGAWPKLCLFHPELKGQMDQVLYLDIDTVVVADIDELFNDPGENLRMLSCGLRWRNFDSSLPPQPATGLLSYRVGEHSEIFLTFANDPDRAYKNFIVEQDFVGDVAKKIDYFPLEWIQSFKYHLRRQYLEDLIAPPRLPGPMTKVVAFHGYPRPSQVAVPGKQWARFPRSGIHRPKWLVDYWKKYSTT